MQKIQFDDEKLRGLISGAPSLVEEITKSCINKQSEMIAGHLVRILPNDAIPDMDLVMFGPAELGGSAVYYNGVRIGTIASEIKFEENDFSCKIVQTFTPSIRFEKLVYPPND